MSNTAPLDAELAGLMTALSGESLRTCVAVAAAPVLQEAQHRVPVRSGHLRDRLGMRSHAAGAHATATVEVKSSGPGGDAHEAVFVEFGTVKMAAEPFMRPAAAASAPAVATAFQTALTGILKGFQ